MADQRWVAQVRDLLRDSVPVEHQTPYLQGDSSEYAPPARRSYDVAEIDRIATWYGLQREITWTLAAADVRRVEDLSGDQLAQLRRRLRQLEDCLQNGLGPPDAPPGI
ncbi:hypothetical protein V3390_00295 [Luteimonas sp. FXH3W]|uniref:Chaperone modulatory protein CbpM n=1 Tax=Aquilutibacter rugosus TaxID=3115820 RepID=A0ABU7UYP1_9GAMM